ncbi:unnamed protein product [Echinostoma caproni]|uniref:Podoplanin n=1 Tax=Echinostoma caproni TaxID=27848 RepID=A0A183ACM5_9TREM|nr:unnamed protein product [Echinostoma caproni]
MESTEWLVNGTWKRNGGDMKLVTPIGKHSCATMLTLMSMQQWEMKFVLVVLTVWAEMSFTSVINAQSSSTVWNTSPIFATMEPTNTEISEPSGTTEGGEMVKLSTEGSQIFTNLAPTDHGATTQSTEAWLTVTKSTTGPPAGTHHHTTHSSLGPHAVSSDSTERPATHGSISTESTTGPPAGTHHHTSEMSNEMTQLTRSSPPPSMFLTETFTGGTPATGLNNPSLFGSSEAATAELQSFPSVVTIHDTAQYKVITKIAATWDNDLEDSSSDKFKALSTKLCDLVLSLLKLGNNKALMAPTCEVTSFFQTTARRKREINRDKRQASTGVSGNTKLSFTDVSAAATDATALDTALTTGYTQLPPEKQSQLAGDFQVALHPGTIAFIVIGILLILGVVAMLIYFGIRFAQGLPVCPCSAP